MLREWLRAISGLFRRGQRTHSVRKPAESSFALPGVHDPGVRVSVHAIDTLHGHSAGGGFGEIMDYVIGFVVIGLVILGGRYWMQRNTGGPAVAPWHAPANPPSGRVGSRWSLSTPKPLPSRDTRTPRLSENNPNPLPEPDSPPVVTHIVPAQYTGLARAANFHGKVFVIVTVGADGIPRKIEPSTRLPFDLEAPIRAAIMQWRFRPGQLHGQTIETRTVVDVPFR